MRARLRRAGGLALLAFAGCTGEAPARRTSPSPTRGARQAWAVARIVDGRPVRWLSRTELCVPPYDAASPVACAARPAQALDDTILRRIRDAVPDTVGTRDLLVCLRVSREIVSGDTTLVFVRTVGDVLVNRRARHEGYRVLFLPGEAADSVRVGRDPEMFEADGPPVEGEEGC